VQQTLILQEGSHLFREDIALEITAMYSLPTIDNKSFYSLLSPGVLFGFEFIKMQNH
jgi:hypothetical protein